ncbi:hypothetical protein WICMUC_005744 [Wickerhamomyces mucosus]|uniref:Mitochondrial 15S rRNA processing factor CCM1 n=1 Tax=Wickerhamomyces mucosus TaxID=1378264 RepID=A0A9P8P3H9_9ASCO|nr:hypothetical protein WICMUC_005744 [Wickerhamomyces mucosus]
MLRLNRVSRYSFLKPLNKNLENLTTFKRLVSNSTTEKSSSTVASKIQNSKPKSTNVNTLKLNLINKSLSEKISQNASSKEIFQELSDKLQTFKQRPGYYSRDLSSNISKLLEKANREAKVPNQRESAPSIEEILKKAKDSGVAFPQHVSFVLRQLINDGDYLGALNQATSFYEYECNTLLNKENVFRDRELKTFTIIAYLAYSANGGEPNKDHVLSLIHSDSLPSQYYVEKDLNRIQNKNLIKTVREKLNILYLSEKNPNSIDSLKKAMIASLQGNTFHVQKALSQARYISKISKKNLNEDTLLAFMKMFNNLNLADESIKLWSELINSNIKPSIYGWNLLLESVSKTGRKRIDQVETVLGEMQKAGIEQNNETIATLINIYQRLGKFDLIEPLINNKDLFKTPNIALSYLESLAFQKKFDKVSEFLIKLKSENIQLTRETYNNLLYNYSINGYYKLAEKLLNEMESRGIKPDVATYTMVLDCTFKLYKQAGLIPKEEFILDFLKDMKKNNIEPNEFTFTSIINTLSKEQSFASTALFLFDYLESNKKASKITYIAMISNEFKLNRIELAEKHIQNYLQNGFPANSSFWSMIFQGWSINKKSDKAKEYLSVLQHQPSYIKDFNKYSVFFLLRLAQQTKDDSLAIEVLDILTQHNYSTLGKPSIELIKQFKKDGIPISEHIESLIK